MLTTAKAAAEAERQRLLTASNPYDVLNARVDFNWQIAAAQRVYDATVAAANQASQAESLASYMAQSSAMSAEYQRYQAE